MKTICMSDEEISGLKKFAHEMLILGSKKITFTEIKWAKQYLACMGYDERISYILHGNKITILEKNNFVIVINWYKPNILILKSIFRLKNDQCLGKFIVEEI